MSLFRCALILFLILPSWGAKLDFVGLESYTKKGLEEAVQGRLDYIKRRPATSFRADDAAYLVETYLRQHGLPDALVNWSLPGGDVIRLTVVEGLAKYLGELTVTGVDVTVQDDVKTQFAAPFPEAGDQRAFLASEVSSGTGRIVALMNSRGYWQASVTATQQTRTVDGKIPFTLAIRPGPLFNLAASRLKSPVGPSTDLAQKLQDTNGQPATSETILKIRKSVQEDYRRRGYSDISIQLFKETDGSSIRLTFNITPGTKYKVRSFDIQGLEKTKKHRIRDLFEGVVGENFDEDEINKSIKRLLSTGAFSSVRLENKQVGETTNLDLTLHLSEAKARGYSFSGGFGSREGFILGARYFDRNFHGRLLNLTGALEFTSLGILGELGLTDPFYYDREMQLSHRLYGITRDYESYRKFEVGFGSELSFDRGEHYSATLALLNSFTHTTSTLPDELLGATNYGISRLQFRQLYDRRDDPALPSDGWFARVDTSLGFSLGEESVGFFEIEGQLSYYDSISDDSSYALGLRGGLIQASGDDENLPIDLRKFLGGSNTVRSFPERELGPQFDNNPLGGTTWWVANAEYIRKIVGPVKAVGFFDAGALDSEVELAAGLGIRIDLPVGPIRLEYGHNLTRDDGEPSGAFHFAIGTTF